MMKNFQAKIQRLNMRLFGLLKSSSARYFKLEVVLLKKTSSGITFQIRPKIEQQTLLSLFRSYIKSSDRELSEHLEVLKFDPSTMQLEVRFNIPKQTDEPESDSQAT